MTNRRSSAALIGAVRLIEGYDTVGIPVFGVQDSNVSFIPETDYRLKIMRFTEFYNEHEFMIDWNVSVTPGKLYAIGDSVPIPFWVNGKPELVDSDIAIREFVGRFQDDDSSPSVQLVKGILHKVAAGTYRMEIAEHEADFYLKAFDDVFNGRPTHSQYWVQRYNMAAQTVRSIGQGKWADQWEALRVRGLEWLNKFATKSKVGLLQKISGAFLQNALFPNEFVKSLWFAIAVDKIARGEWRALESDEFRRTVLNRVPEGVFWHLDENGYPKTAFYEYIPKYAYKGKEVPFVYRKIDDLGAHFLWELNDADRNNDFRGAHILSVLLFAGKALPGDAKELASKFFYERMSEFSSDTKRAFNEVFSEKIHADRWTNTAKWLLWESENLILLRRILQPENRIRDTGQPVGISPELLAEVRKFAKT